MTSIHLCGGQSIERSIRVIEGFVASGDITVAAKVLRRDGPELAWLADATQAERIAALRRAIPELLLEEAAAGGSGSLVDLGHPFQQGIRACQQQAANLAFSTF